MKLEAKRILASHAKGILHSLREGLAAARELPAEVRHLSGDPDFTALDARWSEVEDHVRTALLSLQQMKEAFAGEIVLVPEEAPGEETCADCGKALSEDEEVFETEDDELLCAKCEDAEDESEDEDE